MFFAFANILGPLINPAIVLILVVLAGALAMLLRRWRLAIRLQWLTVAIILCFGVLPSGTWLALPLETRFPGNPPLPDHVAGIIALGGTERMAQSAAWDQPIIRDPEPLAALIALGRKYPDATLAFSGGGRLRRAPNLTESDVAHRFLTELGINADQIIYERRSRNTYENAIFARNLLLPKPDERWILVTEAISMPRAVAVFRAAGWNVIPYPAGYLTAGTHPTLFSLGFGGFGLAALALHEWIGLVVYRLLGYTQEIFPQ